MDGSIRKAEEIAASDPKYFIPQQFKNPAILRSIARQPRGIWRDTDGKVDYLVAGVGTAGPSPVWPR